MNLTVSAGNPLSGVVKLPGDKSLSHRAALFASLADGESCVENYLVAGVTQAMLDALTGLGVAWQLTGTTLRVVGKGLSGFVPPQAALDCGNSATTLRLLAGALTAAGLPATLDGSVGLRRRPMHRIVEPLQKMGANIVSTQGCAPLTLFARDQRLQAIDYTLPVASAQVKSCLLLAALAAERPTVLHEPGPSRDHTERMLRAMGVRVFSTVSKSGALDSSSDYQTTIYPPEPLILSPIKATLPGDISAAAFLIVAALITPDSQVRLVDVGVNPTRTGIIEALQAMGADITVYPQKDQAGEPVADLVVRSSQLRGITVSGDLVVRMIDEFPAFAVAASFANGETLVTQAGELRHKESDRISALCQELRQLNIPAMETEDGFMINGQPNPSGGIVHSHADHRLAMALALVGLAAREPVTVIGAEIIAESFPGFIDVLHELGAEVQGS